MDALDSLLEKLTNGSRAPNIKASLAEEMLGMSEEGREEYYKEWYDSNRRDYLEKRRDRYANDPEYAEKCREAARRYRKERKGGGPVGRMPRKPFKVDVNGKQVDGHTVGHLAERINRSVATVNHWLKNGLLPVTPLVSSGGARLYTDKMIGVIKREVDARIKVRRNDETFYRKIQSGWKRAGVLVE